MSAPGTVKARSSIEIENSCNGPFCCFGHRRHKKRTTSQEKVDALVTAGVMKISVPAEYNAEIARRSARSETEFKPMPSQPNLKTPAKFPL